jgi:ribosomal protein L14E/L6E/L27E
MKIEKADIVISLNGRDAGKRFIVIETDGEYSLIADGKVRRYEKPKRKKNKHIKFEEKADSFITEKLKGNGKITNNEIKRFLATFAAECLNAPSSNEGGMQKCQKTT